MRGLTCSQVAVAQTEAGGLISPQIREHRIRAPHEVHESRTTGSPPQIEGDAALVAIPRFEEQRVLAVLKRRHISAHITAGSWVLDLDDLCPHVRELHSGPRPRSVLLDGDDRQIRERKHEAGPTFRGTVWLDVAARGRRVVALAGSRERCAR